ncbi:GyrI-like domain-containing protein [Pseudoclavibacter helvolus]|uniref:GyrI-like domain-containing protein n=1 Tax=Pseudoclavibacter helvolus TaxID=255205 RepID=UPI003736E950
MTERPKADFKKELDCYQAKSGAFRLLEVPSLQYLMVDGHGDPNTSEEFANAVETLYPVAYTLKFASKKELGRDYTVMPLEGLWWSDDMATFTDARDKSQWNWTLLLMTPDWIDERRFAEAVAKVAAKEPPAWLDRVRLETLEEGLVAQTLHRGSFEDEGPTLARLHDEFIPANGLRMTGKHHEVYFSDFRKTAPEKMRTLLRQPVGRLSGIDPG